MSSGGIAPALRGGAMSSGGIAPALRGGAMSMARSVDFLLSASRFLTFSYIREEEPGMDNRVRDLDQIQEDDGDDRGRRLGTILLATAAVVGLTFAIGVVVGRAAEPAPAATDDPLARLEGVAIAQAKGTKAVALPKVEAADLSFPNTLSEQEERPEVLAALQAAAAEEAALATPSAPAAPIPSAVAAASPTPSLEDESPAPADDGAQAPVAAGEIVANIPAAVAAGAGARSLPKAALHDPLVAAALRDGAPKQSAPRGYEGEYTLQVISYDRPEPSHAFAEGLRAKGHSAFVTAADIPERGRYYRVRIGPFKSREQADAYRSKFEDEEHMNTFVVRLKPED
jgi:cell division septation protein DedD